MTYIIAISGGSGSGKTTASKQLKSLLNEREPGSCALISQDSYYIDQSAHFTGDGSVNYDHPDSIDFVLMEKHLKALLQNQSIDLPIYNFVTHARKKETQLFAAHKYVVVDGILLLAQENLRPLFTCSLFIDIPEKTRFERRLKRDVEERGRTPEGVRQQFLSFVKPMHDLFVQPSQKFATYTVTKNEMVPSVLEKIYKEFLC